MLPLLLMLLSMPCQRAVVKSAATLEAITLGVWMARQGQWLVWVCLLQFSSLVLRTQSSGGGVENECQRVLLDNGTASVHRNVGGRKAVGATVALAALLFVRFTLRYMGWFLRRSYIGAGSNEGRRLLVV